jgi:ferritin-like metal-binding protein YciE
LLTETLEEEKEMDRKLSEGKKCKGVEGLADEGAEVINEDFEGALIDAASGRSLLRLQADHR